MNDATVKTAVIGLGRWGKNVARELAQVSDLVGYVTTGSEESSAWAATHLSGARALTLAEVCANPEIEAVAVATPISTHTDIALTLISAGKHVFMEKPLAPSAAEAARIEEAARIHDVTLMTGYVFLYAPAYRALKEHMHDAPIKEIEMQWRKYGTFTETIEANLQTHHLALALDLCGEPVSGTVQRGAGVESPCDSIETRLDYDIYSVTSIIDRASQEHTHTIDIRFTDDTHIRWEGTNLIGRNNEILYSNDREPLKEEMQAFIAAIGGADEPTAGGFGTQVLRLAERLKVQ